MDTSGLEHSKFYTWVYSILVEFAGAPLEDTEHFIRCHCERHTEERYTEEYRFQGIFGMGGKYYHLENKIQYYREDETPEKNEIRDKVNALLSSRPVQLMIESQRAIHTGDFTFQGFSWNGKNAFIKQDHNEFPIMVQKIHVLDLLDPVGKGAVEAVKAYSQNLDEDNQELPEYVTKFKDAVSRMSDEEKIRFIHKNVWFTETETYEEEVDDHSFLRFKDMFPAASILLLSNQTLIDQEQHINEILKTAGPVAFGRFIWQAGAKFTPENWDTAMAKNPVATIYFGADSMEHTMFKKAFTKHIKAFESLREKKESSAIFTLFEMLDY